MSEKEKVLAVLKELSQTEKMQGIQIGLFGSYARNDQSKLSDIDIVLKAQRPLLLIEDEYEEFIKEFIYQKLHCECDVVDYADLVEDYKLYEKENLGEYTIKRNVDREAIMI